ncbi:MAG: hypothetical protein AAF288_07680 [Planctomycetota bacterium]
MRLPERAYTALAACAAIAFVGGALYGPTLWERGRVLSRTLQDRAALADLGQPNLNAAYAQVDSAQKDFDQTERKVTLGPSPESALSALADAASAADLLDYSVATKAATDAPFGARAIPVEVQAVGGFKQGFQVLREIENAPRLIRVDRLTMTDLGQDRPSGEDQTDELSPPRVETRLELSAFYQPDGGAP